MAKARLVRVGGAHSVMSDFREDEIARRQDQLWKESQYDSFANEFLDHASNGFYNAHYDRPACLNLLGDVVEKRVLDAACGPGLYAEEQCAAEHQ